MPTHVLLLVNSPIEAAAITRTLNAVFSAVATIRVDTREAFLHALIDFTPELMVAESSLPHFSGCEGVAWVREHLPQVPLILIAEWTEEESALKLLSAGATDVVSRDGRPRLGLAAVRALQEVRDRASRRRLWEALQQREAEYRSIIDNAPEGIFQTTPSGSFLSANPALLRILGYATLEELQARVTSIARDLYVDPGARGRLARQLETHDNVVGFEAEVRTREDRTIWVSESVHAVRDPRGNLLRYEGTVEDITNRKRAELALSESEEQLRLALAAGAMGMYDWDLGSGNLVWSEQHARLWGIDPNEFDGRYETFAGRVHRDDLTPVEAAIAEAKRTGADFECEYRIHRPDGTERWIADRGRFQFDAQGQARRMNGLVMDITERRQSAARLEESQRMNATLWETAADAILMVDARGTIEQMNSEAERLFGYSRAELVGQPLEVLIPERHRATHAIRCGNFHACQQIRRMGEGLELTAVRHDGSELPVEISLSPLCAPSGNTVMAIVRDISGRVHAERHLQEQVRRMSLLNQIARDIARRDSLDSLFTTVLEHLEAHLSVDFGGISLYDEARDALTVAARGPRSRSLAEQLGRPVGTVIDEQNRFKSFARLRNGETVYQPDLSAVDSVPFVQQMLALGLRSTVLLPLIIEGRLLGTLSVCRRQRDGFSNDEIHFLTALAEQVALAANQARLLENLRQAYDRLHVTQQQVVQQERLRALGTMASGIAHDFNNALSPIVAYTELLLSFESVLNDPERLRRYLTTMSMAAQDASKVVSRLREFYRHREEAEVFLPLDLRQLVKQAIELTAPKWKSQAQMESRTIQIETLLSRTPPIAGNEYELRELLTNLIFNAVDAMPQGGVITIATVVETAAPGSSGESGSPRHVVLSVGDTGHGMTEEVQRRCLEPFFTTKGEHGSGLGLAMVHGIVRRHEGTLDLQSEWGAGTTMQIRLPVFHDTEREMRAPAAAAATSPLRVLAVDDEAGVRDLLTEVLTADGHTVIPSGSGREALELFHRDRFDLVIIDRAMPDISGDRLAATLRRLAPEKPIIMLTGFGDFMNASGELQPDANVVLGKPVTPAELRGAITMVMRYSPPA